MSWRKRSKMRLKPRREAVIKMKMNLTMMKKRMGRMTMMMMTTTTMTTMKTMTTKMTDLSSLYSISP